jgi:hypothetical protein
MAANPAAGAAKRSARRRTPMVIIILFYNHPRSADGGGLNCGQTTANSRQCGQSSAVCHLGLEGIVSKKMNAPYRSGPSRVWIKVKNPKSPAATRAVDWNVLIRLGTLRRQLEFSVLIPFELVSKHDSTQQRNDIGCCGACFRAHRRIHYSFCGTFAVPFDTHELSPPKAPAATRAIDGTF